MKNKNAFRPAIFAVLFLSLFLTLSIPANNVLFAQNSTPSTTKNPNQGQTILPQQATLNPNQTQQSATSPAISPNQTQQSATSPAISPNQTQQSATSPAL